MVSTFSQAPDKHGTRYVLGQNIPFLRGLTRSFLTLADTELATTSYLTQGSRL
jgi:hypothetical protein